MGPSRRFATRGQLGTAVERTVTAVYRVVTNSNDSKLGMLTIEETTTTSSRLEPTVSLEVSSLSSTTSKRPSPTCSASAVDGDLAPGIDDEVLDLADRVRRIRLAVKEDFDLKARAGNRSSPCGSRTRPPRRSWAPEERPLIGGIGVVGIALHVDDLLDRIGSLEVERTGADPEVPLLVVPIGEVVPPGLRLVGADELAERRRRRECDCSALAS